MRYLLDTHVWLWMQAAEERIRPDLLVTLRDPRNTLLLSAASSWEIAIKWQLGRLALPEPPSSYIPSRMRRSGVDGLAIEHAHVLQVATVPMRHRDPFDRLLVAQAQTEKVPIVTADAVFDDYEVTVIPAI